MKYTLFLGAMLLLLPALPSAAATLPPPPDAWTDFPISLSPDFPGDFAADSLLDKPAGKNGPIVVKAGHFYTNLVNGKRIRFLGVNFCFAACFPTHQQADLIAPRLARLGINAVRFHHMDSQPFPAGIFADKKLETLDPIALDRLDYFIAALKKNGVYADLNLHVSRQWTKAHPVPGAAKTPDMDKLIDLFDPDLIDAQKTYAHDLLTHVNAYTKNAYTDEPAVCMVEINNENTFFIWGGDKRLAEIPDPYAATLQQLWNKWLAQKYVSRKKLAAAWNAGAQPLGDNLLKLPGENKLAPWRIEHQQGAAMTAQVSADKKTITLNISKITATAWHLQLKQPGLAIKKGQFYTLTFTASADGERPIELGVQQEGPPYKNLGLANYVTLTKSPRNFRLNFIANDNADNARLTFSVGQQTGSIVLSDISLAPGGQHGLDADENPITGTVKRHDPTQPFSPARLHDWYDFLQSLDQQYFTSMYRYLRQDLRLHTPITGTIGLGALGTLSQSKMDFVDAHAYWDHPAFPGKPWDPNNWRIHNTPMVDSPAGATFPNLAAIRVYQKPFTVTEYNHPAPNDYQAECLPLLAATAALQDWDAIYLFAWSHNARFDADHADSYFDTKANPAKLYQFPAAARIFLSGSVKPLPVAPPILISRERSLGMANQYLYRLWPQLMDTQHLTADVLLKRQLAICFQPPDVAVPPAATDPRPLSWTSSGVATGQFSLNDPAAAVFVGFPKKDQSIPLGPLTLTQTQTPFITATLTSADGKTALDQSPRLLLTLVARTQNTGMQWNAARNSVGTHWGKAPTQIEPVNATLILPAGYTIVPLDSAGAPGQPLAKTGDTVNLQSAKTLWYEIRRTP